MIPQHEKCDWWLKKKSYNLHGDTKENKKKKKIYTLHAFKTVQMKCINVNKVRKKMSY